KYIIYGFFFLEWHYGMSVGWDIYIIYLIQCSFYLHSVYATLYLDVWRKDSIVMLIHHFLTLSLIGFSYAARYVYHSHVSIHTNSFHVCPHFLYVLPHQFLVCSFRSYAFTWMRSHGWVFDPVHTMGFFLGIMALVLLFYCYTMSLMWNWNLLRQDSQL